MKALKYICLSGLFLSAVGFTACEDDDDYFDSDAQGKSIVVERVYLENVDSKTPDRDITGTFARVGQLIRLEGSGLYGMKKVYINGYDTYFNRAYVSDNSMLITINKNTPVVDAEPAERNKIRLVKDGAEFTFDNLVIRAASPVVSFMSCTMPQKGETVVVFGENLQEVSKVTLPGGVEVTEGLESDDAKGEWFTFVMPDGVTEGGSVSFECANGSGRTPAYFNVTKGLILNFDGVGKQGYWGGKDDDGNIKAGASMVYDSDLVDDPAGSGRGLCLPIVPQRLLDEGGIASGKPRASECWTAGNDEESDDWSRFFDLIPAETPTTEIAFQFDIYCPEEWSKTGYIQICLFNNFNYSGIKTDDDSEKSHSAFCVPWIEDGEIVPFKTTGWQTLTIPFSSITADGKRPSESNTFGGFYDMTFQDVVDARNAASYRNFGMGFVNTDFTYDGVEVVSEKFTGPSVYTDNWRIVSIKSQQISDYPEDDED